MWEVERGGCSGRGEGREAAEGRGVGREAVGEKKA